MSLLTIGLLLVGLAPVLFAFEIWYETETGWAIAAAVVALVAGAFCLLFATFPADNRVWVKAPGLATQACVAHGGVRGMAARASYRGGTDGWLVTCNDNAVVEIPDGKWRDDG